MNRKLKKVAFALYFIALSLGFVLVYYGGYYYALNYMKADNVITKEALRKDNPTILKGEEQGHAEQANQSELALISEDTTYIEERFHLDTKKLEQEVLPVPTELLGYDRQACMEYLSEYMSNNKDDSLVNIQMISFSPERIVLRKNIQDVEHQYHFFVTVQGECIMVFYSDRTSLYLDTGISIDSVDEEERSHLETGFYIETIHELYNYLEGITS